MKLLKWYDGWPSPSEWADVRLVEKSGRFEIRTKRGDFILSVSDDQLAEMKGEGVKISEVNWKLS